MEQGRLTGGVLYETPLEDLGVALERCGLLFAVGRADMFENPTARLPFALAGLEDQDECPAAQLFPAYEHAGEIRMAKSKSQKNFKLVTTRSESRIGPEIPYFVGLVEFDRFS